MKHRLFSLTCLLVVFTLILPSSEMATRAQAAAGRAVPQAIPSSNQIFLPMVMRENENVVPVIPDTTVPLSDESTNQMTISPDGTTFTFAEQTSELMKVDTGDVIVGDASTAAPDGFLRKVSGVNELGGQVVVETEAATLEDTIQDGAIDAGQALDPGDISSSVLKEGVTMIANPQGKSALTFQYSLDKVLYQAEHGDIRATGIISFTTGFNFNLKIKDFRLKYISFTNTTSETSSLTIASTIEYSGGVEVEVAKHRFKPITYWVGVFPVMVPVVIIPELTVYIGLDGSVRAGITAGVSQTASLTAGLQYNSGAWSPVWILDNSFTFTKPTPSLDMILKAYAGVGLALKLYGVAGPYVNVQTYLELDVAPLEYPWWSLYAGLEVPAGVEMEISSEVIASYEVTVFDHKWLLMPPDPPKDPSPPHDAINQAIDVNLSWTNPDSSWLVYLGPPLTFNVYFDAGDSPPSTLICSNQAGTTCDPGTLSPSTVYSWKVRANGAIGTSTDGPVWSFTTVAAPGAFNKSSPADSATGVATNPTVSWGASSNASSYEYCIATTYPCSNWASTGTSTSVGLSGLSNNTKYYWQVRANNANGTTYANGVMTDWSFTTVTGEACPIHITLGTVDNSWGVTVNGSATSECSTITHILWDWGDGQSDEQSFPAHHFYYDEIPLYYYGITITAQGNQGNQAVATTTATVGSKFSGMTPVPAGNFSMGCYPEHNGGFGCEADELPVHTVTMAAYYIDSSLVTNYAFKQCVTVGACTAPSNYSSETRASYYNNPDYDYYPVIYVNWSQAEAFCTWREGRLPTEAEWENAARGSSDTRAFPWGDGSPDCTLANFNMCLGDTSNVYTHGSGRSPNYVYDMAGNVWEWVRDWYSSTYYVGSPTYNPTGPGSGTFRVLRGGGWLEGGDSLRVANRYSGDPAETHNRIGFRCAVPDVP